MARIAAKHLTAKARDSILKLLDSDPNDVGSCSKNRTQLEERLACVSTWADVVRSDPRFRSTLNQHFVDIPIYVSLSERHYDAERDCPKGDCLVGAIDKYKAVLSSPTETASTRALALKFLVHFVADIHQPLHAATDRDRDPGETSKLQPPSVSSDAAGNRKLVKWLGQSYSFGVCFNLHQVWDDSIIERRDSKDNTYAALLDAKLSPKELSILQQGTAIDWANESYKLAIEYAYGALPAPSLNKLCAAGISSSACADYNPKCTRPVTRYRYSLDINYYNKTLPIVEMQLSRAGIRLSRLLNDIFDPASSQPRRSPEKPPLKPGR